MQYVACSHKNVNSKLCNRNWKIDSNAVSFSVLFFFCSLISNSLNINSNGHSPATENATSLNRGFQRRLNIAPLNFDDNSNGSPIKMSEEMSMYSGNTPQGSPRPCSISPCSELLSPSRECESIEERHDFDYNSMDSGYSQNISQKMFTFAQPALPVKRSDTISPPKSAKRDSPKSISCFRSFNSLSSDSMESMDDDCMDLLDMEALDENAQLPTSFNTIISGNIKSNSSYNDESDHDNSYTMKTQSRSQITISRTPMFRRCLSMTDGNVNRGRTHETTSTPEMFKAIPEMDTSFECLSKTFKRPEPPSVVSPIQSKRYKQSVEDKENLNEMQVSRPVLRKSLSMNDDLIMNALSRCKYLQISAIKSLYFKLINGHEFH